MCCNVDLIVQPGLYLPNRVRKFRRDGQSFQVAFVLFTYGCAGSRFVWLSLAAGRMGLVAAAPRLWSTGSIVVAHRLGCPVASGILLTRDGTRVPCTLPPGKSTCVL